MENIYTNTNISGNAAGDFFGMQKGHGLKSLEVTKNKRVTQHGEIVVQMVDFS